MKSPQDPRHRKRLDKVQRMFSYSFSEKQHPPSIQPILKSLESIDRIIQEAAPEWPLDKINKVDLAILRVATHEILHDEAVPTKVSINEAVEIAKIYGSESSPSFVNGVLGTILKTKDKK